MQVRQLLLILLAAMTLPAGLALAQSPEDARTLELVDRLKEVIQRAERNRVDGATVNQLKDLVRRYDWPSSVPVMVSDCGCAWVGPSRVIAQISSPWATELA